MSEMVVLTHQNLSVSPHVYTPIYSLTVDVQVVRGFDGTPDDVRVLSNTAQALTVVFSGGYVRHHGEHPVADGHHLHDMLPQKRTQQNVNTGGTGKDPRERKKCKRHNPLRTLTTRSNIWLPDICLLILCVVLETR